MKRVATYAFKAVTLLVVPLSLLSGCAHYKVIPIESDPSGATIYVNKKRVGITPTKHEFLNVSGTFESYLVEAELAGYEKDYQEFRETKLIDFSNFSFLPLRIFFDLKPLNNTSLQNSNTVAPTQRVESSNADVSLSPRTFPLRNIAIAGLESLAVSDAEALTLSESLRASIVNSDYFTVVSRADMKRILEEHEFQRTDLADTKTLVEMGKIIGVEKIIGGSIGRVGDTFSLSVRMVDVETAKVDVSVVQDVQGREDALLKAIRSLGNQLCLRYAESRTRP